MSLDFKFFWAVTIPLTFLVFGVYILWRWLKANEARRDGKSSARVPQSPPIVAMSDRR